MVVKKYLLAKHLAKNELEVVVLKSRFQLLLIKNNSFVMYDPKNSLSQKIADHVGNKNWII